ncbi:TRAP transporter small permease subunit [Tropicimonas sp. TH_r6]|uniref:TRAP transporter small permease n=1 Tax=Tropicimonas sp. TH_r6 TaxID=3082085 RepID=UPI00295473FB|nr:TRAP transporter small permease subunit [Tropicimonas sp. TH_r6]MDV7142335.1 TRAP transporter small permease subunit [Tropicimonas sp. TH_r6]
MLALLRPLCWVNTHVLRVGRSLGWVALALMVFVILLQVFFRYALNNALNWPDEAARFLMLWMTGLMAPSAYRWGGFVAIDMLPQALPRTAGLVLSLVILVLSLFVLVIGVQHGYEHTFGFGGKFNSSSLRIPLEWAGMETVKVKLKFMYMSLFVGMILLISVNIELILRSLIQLLDEDAELPSDDAPDTLQSAD